MILRAVTLIELVASSAGLLSKLHSLIATTKGARTFQNPVFEPIFSFEVAKLLPILSVNESSDSLLRSSLSLAANAASLTIQQAYLEVEIEEAFSPVGTLLSSAVDFTAALDRVEESARELRMLIDPGVSSTVKANESCIIARIRRNVARKKTRIQNLATIIDDLQSLEFETDKIRDKAISLFSSFFFTAVEKRSLSSICHTFEGLVKTFRTLHFQYMLLTASALKAKEVFAILHTTPQVAADKRANLAYIAVVKNSGIAKCFDAAFGIADAALAIIVKAILRESATCGSPEALKRRLRCGQSWANCCRQVGATKREDVYAIDTNAALGDIQSVCRGTRGILRDEAVRVRSVHDLIDNVTELLKLL